MLAGSYLGQVPLASKPFWPISAAIGVASETNQASTLGQSKGKALTRASETDSGFSWLAIKKITRATEVDTARTVAQSKVYTVALVSETDTAEDVVFGVYPVDKATETDSAFGLSKHKTQSPTIAVEVDFAGNFYQQKFEAIARVSETDSGFAIERVHRIVLGTVSEADTAQPVAGKFKVKLVDLAAEADSARPFTPTRFIPISRTSETDSTFGLARSKSTLLGRAFESDTATGFGSTKVKLVSLVEEADQAFTVTRVRTVGVSTAEETDSVFGWVVFIPPVVDLVLSERSAVTVSIGEMSGRLAMEEQLA